MSRNSVHSGSQAYKIVRGLDIPVCNNRMNKAAPKFPFMTLSIGECMEIPNLTQNDIQNLRVSLYQIQRHCKEYNFATRVVNESCKYPYRKTLGVWRVL